jgi:hypothetical protein
LKIDKGRNILGYGRTAFRLQLKQTPKARGGLWDPATHDDLTKISRGQGAKRFLFTPPFVSIIKGCGFYARASID